MDISVREIRLAITQLIPGHAAEIRRMANDDGVPTLNPDRCRYLPLVSELSGGRLCVRDGFHRLAGMLQFGGHLRALVVAGPVDWDAIPDDALPGCDELDEIYGAAGVL